MHVKRLRLFIILHSLSLLSLHKGSYECINQCGPGLSLDLHSHRCADIDECSTGEASCAGDGKTCVNTIGSYRCECPVGYEEEENDDTAAEDRQGLCPENVS